MRSALLGLVACASAASAGPLSIRADRLHLGDGRVVAPAIVIVEGDRVAYAGDPSHAPSPADARDVRCADLLPGLVAWRRPAEPDDPESADPQRFAVDLAGADDAAPDELHARGITTLAMSPGIGRLVGGRIGLLRLRADGREEEDLRDGSLLASLRPEALNPPPVFEPVLRVNPDNPLQPARLQRPSTPMAATGELRRLLASDDDPWPRLRDGDVALAVAARDEASIRNAIALAEGAHARLVVVGGDEAWKLASDLAAARASVVLEPSAPSPDLESRADAAALLTRAGVAVALADPSQDPADPLLLAARAVREGLDRESALAAITGLSARAAGRASAALVAGAPADLVGFDADPLAARATPTLLVAGGRLVDARTTSPAKDADEDDAPPIALRVGRALDADHAAESVTILVRGGRIASIASGDAVPAGVRVVDLGSGSVATPGFVDAFSRVGLDAGAPAAGSARVRAEDAIAPDHRSLRDALAAGVTIALAVPATRGSVLGSASVIGLLTRTAKDEPPKVDAVASDAALVAWLDDGPADAVARQVRLKGFKELVQRAKSYNDAWAKSEKKPEGKPKKHPMHPADDTKPDKDASLEPWRGVFAGRTKLLLRSGREDLIVAGLDALKAAGITPVLCGGEEADRVAKDLASRGITVVLSPSSALRREPTGTVNVAAELRAAGVAVAFGSFATAATSDLPSDVAALVREGLAPEDALAALTTTAAAACGQAAPAGRLVAGARADVAVFDGDPMEPASRVLLVLARGHVAFERGADGVASAGESIK